MKMFGIPLRIDFSWLFILTMVVWSLAGFVFPEYCKDQPLGQSMYWLMGLVGGIGIFSCILFHELSHAIVAKRHGLSINSITLFIFGGVAEIIEEPPSSRAEFRMAVAGPLFSFLAAALFALLESISVKLDFPISVRAVLNYWAWGNFALAAFNLMPAFPLDGGRILRAFLWRRKKSLFEATRIASKIGSGFGIALMVLGGITFLFRNFVGGMWYFLIGMFLKGAAETSFRQLMLKRSFEGELVSRFMKTNPVTVSPETSLKDLVDNFFVRYQFKIFPVVEEEFLVGRIGIKDIKKISRSAWQTTPIRKIMQPITESNSVSPNTDAKRAFMLMSRKGEERLLVVDKGKLEGVITLKDMLDYFALILEFETPEKAAA